MNQYCKRKNFEGCINICKRSGENIENCINMCSVAVKRLYSENTRLGMEIKPLSPYIETESNTKGWVLVISFLTITTLLVWKLFL